MENQFAVSEDEICALFDKLCITETQNKVDNYFCYIHFYRY